MRSELPDNRAEIALPYTAVETAYGPQLLEILTRKSKSTATKAINMPAAAFKWFLAYSIEQDPATVDPREFVDTLVSQSKVWLIGRGHHWRDWELLPSMPQQVLVRFEERARLKCGAASRSTGEFRPRPTDVSAVQSVGEEVALSATFARWVAANPAADPLVVSIVSLGIQLLERE